MPSLEQLMDYDADFPSEWENGDSLNDIEVKRLKFDFCVARCVPTIPRRLGIYATREQLSADEKLGRRMATVALRGLQWRSAAESWMLEWVQAGYIVRKMDEAYKQAAQRLWNPWYYDRVTWLEQHIPVVACWGVKSGRRKDGNELCSRLIGEKDLMEEVWQKTAPLEWREPDDHANEAAQRRASHG